MTRLEIYQLDHPRFTHGIWFEIEGICQEFRTNASWPRLSQLYMRRTEGLRGTPGAELTEVIQLLQAERRGRIIYLTADRARDRRSQILFTTSRDGKELILWQSPRTVRKARPGVRIPRARASGMANLTIFRDGREQHPLRFTHQKDKVSIQKATLALGDYAIGDPTDPWASVERKQIDDFRHSVQDGSLGYVMGELERLPRGAVVVEAGYGAVLKTAYGNPGFLADQIAQLQVLHPAIPIVFCESRALAEEWIYRYLAAAYVELGAPAASQRDLLDCGAP
jgi:hypothetical protein